MAAGFIPIYGLLKNDTGGALTEADQILDVATGKRLSERLAEIESLAGAGESMSDDDVSELLAELFGD